MTLNSKDIETFKMKVNQWKTNDFLNEKQVETEFYNIAEKYYHNKYSLKSSGYLSYNANHNIDGLLEIRTIEIDYRVLVEAKREKNYNDRDIRNAVLSQAIHYIKKLYSIGEQIPSVILLIDQSQCVIYETSQLEECFQTIQLEERDFSPSMAYLNDSNLINNLNNLNPQYKSFAITSVNEIFNHVDNLAYVSQYRKVKTPIFKDNLLDYELIEKTLKNEMSLFYNSTLDQFFYFEESMNSWVTIKLDRVKVIIKQFLMRKRLQSSTICVMELIEYLKAEEDEIVNDNIDFLNGVLSITRGKLLTDKSNHHCQLTLPFNYVRTAERLNSNYSLQKLVEILLLQKTPCDFLFIKTDRNNFNHMREFLRNFSFISEVSNNYWKDGELVKYLLIDDLGELKSKNIDIGSSLCQLIEIDSFMSPDSFISEIIDYAINNEMFTNCNYEKLSPDFDLINWNEENDLLLAWFKECLNPNPNSMIIFSDALDSFNNFCLTKGNSKVSSRYFSQTFTSHRIFRTYSLVY